MSKFCRAMMGDAICMRVVRLCERLTMPLSVVHDILMHVGMP